MVVGAHEFDGVLLLAALGQRCLHLGGRLGHGLIHALDGHGGTLRNRRDDHRLGVLGQARGQARLGLCGVTVAGSLEQIGDNRLLRGEAKAARVGKAKTTCGKDNQQKHPYQTSWGLSTRIIGGLIMTHGDNNGLVLPPRIAPVQVVVVPVAQHKPGVIEKAQELFDSLKAAGVRVKIDTSDNSLGWKCAQYEMKGVPLRIEIGPKDIENNQCVAVRRDDREKLFLSLDELDTKVPELLDAVQQGLFDKAKKNLDEHIFEAHSLEEAKQLQEEKGGFIKTMWCGELDCELKMKEQAGMSSRCIPFKQENLGDTCPICGKKAKHMIYWGVAY